MATPGSTKAEKKHKKRVRDEEAEDGVRKHKRSKSEALTGEISVRNGSAAEKISKKSKKRLADPSDSHIKAESEEADASVASEKAQKKAKKPKSKFITPEKAIDSDSDSDAAAPPVQTMAEDLQEANVSKPEKHKQDKKAKKEKREKKEKQRKDRGQDASQLHEEASAVEKKPRKEKRRRSPELDVQPVQENDATLQLAARATKTTSKPKIPFLTQTVSLYVPFFPLGFSKLPSELACEVLDPMLNTFSTALRGILLAYRNATLSEHPVRTRSKTSKTEDKPVLICTIDECPAGFAWLTAEMDLFCPSRGAAMEGKLTLQSEGHIGLVCWGKFNASIEASRLPPGWTWIDTSHETGREFDDDSAMQIDGEADGKDMLDKDGIEQLHSVGYWVDESGMRVSGKLSFRIKDFQLFAGDHQYLSIQGTMLEEDAEKALAAQERQAERARRAKQNPTGLLRPLQKRLPDFSMTTIGDEEQEEEEVGEAGQIGQAEEVGEAEEPEAADIGSPEALEEEE